MELVKVLTRIVEGLKYGSVELTVKDGKVVKIEKRETFLVNDK